MEIQAGHFYFIKDEFFEKIKDKELMVNKENGHMRPCYYCFKDNRNNGLYWFIPVSSKLEKYQAIYDKKLARYKRVDTIVFGYIYGRKSAFLIQNMFPTTMEYIKEEYIKQNKKVTINDDLKNEINKKANRVLELVKAGNKHLVFPDIINIEKIYSAFPCPKLWSSSFGALAILFPINVIKEAKISPALFILSAIIA